MHNLRRILSNTSYLRNRNLTKILNPYRQLLISSPSRVKMYEETENKHAYNIMYNKGYTMNLEPEKCISSLSNDQFETILQQNWASKTPQKLFEIFQQLSAFAEEHGLKICDKIFDNYIDYLTDNLKHASDQELETIFYSLMKWPETQSIRTRNYIEIWVALDDECLRRIKNWSYDEIILYMTLFYQLNAIRYSDFCHKSLNKLASKAKNLTISQLVQTLFFVSLNRKSPFDMHNFEVQLEINISKLSIDELAIISMGFFKSKTPIRNMDLINKIIDKIVGQSKQIHEVSLAALLKLIRYSMKFPLDNKLYNLLDILHYEVPRLSIMCNVHLALLGTTTLTFNEKCLTAIAGKVVKSLTECRLKDLERLVLTFGFFSYIPNTIENFFEQIMDELRKPKRNSEIEIHGRSFACTVAYLGLVGIYPIDLISKALNPEFLERTYGKYCATYGREILTLHNSAEIFYKDIDISRLSEKQAVVMSNMYTDYLPSEVYKKQYNVTDKQFLDVKRVLEIERGGKDFVTGWHILTHYQRGDIIICNNHEGVPLPVLEVFDKKTFGTVKTVPDNNIWVVLVIAGRNSMIHGTDSATGPFVTKVKELKALGYYAELVTWNMYSQLETDDEKICYLNDLIKKAVNNTTK